MDIIDEVEAARKGDKKAFATLIQHYEKDMYRVSKSILHNEDDCCDAVQETILKAYKNIAYLKDPECFRAWLLKILANTCYQVQRGKKKNISTDEISDIPNNYDVYSNLELRQVINGLEDNLKSLVVMYYLEDIPIKEISEILGIPSGTIKSRLSRARAQLSQALDEEKVRLCYE